MRRRERRAAIRHARRGGDVWIERTGAAPIMNPERRRLRADRASWQRPEDTRNVKPPRHWFYEKRAR